MPGPSNDNLHKALLPQGLRDLLPPDAEAEAEAVGRLVAVLTSHGYERVKPPLMEFEENLLSGAGAAMAPETFRLMDPISQRMVGLRADMTTQIARIAGARLANAPRPLRLCYAGEALRVRGSDMQPERQICPPTRGLSSTKPTRTPHSAAPAAAAMPAGPPPIISTSNCLCTNYSCVRISIPAWQNVWQLLQCGFPLITALHS